MLRHTQITRASAIRRRGSGFTLIEVLLVVAIIALLVSILFVAVGAAVRSVRGAAEREYVRSLAMSVEQYKQSFGQVPPLVADGATSAEGPLVAFPVGSQPARPRLKGEANGDLARAVRFLRYELEPDDGNTVRWSKYSLPIYVLGVLGEKYDGVAGPGFSKPDSDGIFARSGGQTRPLFDVSRQTERVRVDPAVAGEDDQAARTYLVDRWNNPIRYYRWLPTYHTTGAATPSVYPGAPGNDVNRAKEIRSYNVPAGVGDPAANPALRSARCAIVSAGPDGRIDDLNVNSPDNLDNIVEVVQ